jgi:APA family basic amino acid/polyamine antiporter
MISGGAIATLAVAFSTYMNELVPLGTWGAKLVSIVMIGVIMAINVRGTRQSRRAEHHDGDQGGRHPVIGVILLVSGRGLSGPGVSVWPDEWNGSIFAGILAAMIGVLWAYEGWQYATFRRAR